MKAQIKTGAPRAHKLAWDDIPYVLAVCEAGSRSGAARRMRVNHSTVFRRIEGLERRLGVRLFERHRSGYVMTVAGERLYVKALKLRDGIDQIELELGGDDLRLEGPLTVTTTDSLLHVLTPLLAQFQADHPKVTLRVLADASALDLSRRDADIALRPTLAPPGHWIGRKLARVEVATYADARYWDQARIEAPETWQWITLDDDLDQSPMSKVTHHQKLKDAPMTVISTVMGVYAAARAAMGLAVLPTYLGDGCAGLKRVGEPDGDHAWELWLLAHPEMRRSARVHAFFEFASARVPAVLGDSNRKGP